MFARRQIVLGAAVAVGSAMMRPLAAAPLALGDGHEAGLGAVEHAETSSRRPNDTADKLAVRRYLGVVMRL